MTEDITSEQAVLASLIMDGARMMDCSFLKPDDFSFAENRNIFQEMIRMPGGVDLLRLSKCPNLDKGYIQEILVSTRGSKSKNVEHYARVVKDCSTMRKLKRLCMETDTAIMRGKEAWVVVEDFERNACALSMDMMQDAEPSMIGPVALEAVEHFKRIAAGEQVDGAPTHLETLNGILGGMRPSELLVVAARTSCGKSAFLANLADYLGKTGRPALLLSLEMDVDSMARRLVQIRGQVATETLRWPTRATSEIHNAETAATSMRDDPVTLSFCKHRTISAIKSKCRRWAAKYKDGVILVDYLQRITASSESQRLNRYQQVGEASAGLKDIAIELQCPVVVAAQLGRGAEKEKGQGMMAHLRESGDIEQDADAVIILAPIDDADKKKNNLAMDTISIMLTKNRNGRTGAFLARFDKPTQRIMDISQTRKGPASEFIKVVEEHDALEYEEDTAWETQDSEELF